MTKPAKIPPSRLAAALTAALPAPPVSHARTIPIMLRVSEDEAEVLRAAAKLRKAPLATCVRDLAVAGARLLTE